MLDNANLITKTVFPAEIVPVSIFLSSLASHLMVVALVIAGIGVIQGHFSMWMLMLPIYMLLVGLFAIGVGWIVASLQVYLRDTAQVLSVILVFWFWVTPIFITEQQIPERFRFALHLNPLAFVVQAYRDRLLSYRIPSLHDLAIITAYAITAFVAGGLFFRHLKRGFRRRPVALPRGSIPSNHRPEDVRAQIVESPVLYRGPAGRDREIANRRAGGRVHADPAQYYVPRPYHQKPRWAARGRGLQKVTVGKAQQIARVYIQENVVVGNRPWP